MKIRLEVRRSSTDPRRWWYEPFAGRFYSDEGDYVAVRNFCWPIIRAWLLGKPIY